MSDTIEKKPLDPSSFPPNLQMHASAKAPAPIKMMAARAMLPASPPVTLRLLYQVGLDEDEAVRKAARASLRSLPENVLGAALGAEQPASVLDWVAQLRSDDAALSALVVHAKVDDRSVARAASAASASVCDIIASNQVRALRSPSIIEALYKNPNARMATVNRLTELAHREGVELDIPGLAEALASGEEIGLGDPSDEEFDKLLAAEAEAAALEEERDAELEGLTRSERERFEEERAAERAEEAEELDDAEIVRAGTIAQKIRLATIGRRVFVVRLTRDPNRLVHMAAVGSPKLRYNDVRDIASNKSAPDGVINYLANSREWSRHHEIMVRLVSNPKTPIANAYSMMNHLRPNELRELARNRDVSHQVARQAKNLMNKRSGKR